MNNAWVEAELWEVGMGASVRVRRLTRLNGDDLCCVARVDVGVRVSVRVPVCACARGNEDNSVFTTTHTVTGTQTFCLTHRRRLPPSRTHHTRTRTQRNPQTYRHAQKTDIQADPDRACMYAHASTQAYANTAQPDTRS